jgi:hypothetical protein
VFTYLFIKPFCFKERERHGKKSKKRRGENMLQNMTELEEVDFEEMNKQFIETQECPKFLLESYEKLHEIQDVQAWPISSSMCSFLNWLCFHVGYVVNSIKRFFLLLRYHQTTKVEDILLEEINDCIRTIYKKTPRSKPGLW